MISRKLDSNVAENSILDPDVKHQEDLEMCRALLAGDERQFNEFFEHYFPRLYRFCLSRLKDDTLVEDIVQTTMIKATKAMNTYRGDASLFTWLCLICRNEINMHFRKEARSLPEVHAEDDAIRPILEMLESDASPEAEFESARASALIIEILDFLPGNYGQALEWKYILGLSVTEIAERLETTELAELPGQFFGYRLVRQLSGRQEISFQFCRIREDLKIKHRSSPFLSFFFRGIKKPRFALGLPGFLIFDHSGRPLNHDLPNCLEIRQVSGLSTPFGVGSMNTHVHLHQTTDVRRLSSHM